MELLVAMALGLLLIAGIGKIYLAAKQSYDIQNRLAQIQDVGRYATEILTQDIRRAGFWGLMDMKTAGSLSIAQGLTSYFPSGDVTATGGCPTGDADWGRMVTQPLFGLDDTATGYACLSGNWKQGDVLVVRYADPTSVTSFDPDGLYIRTAPYQASVVFGNPAAPTILSSPNPTLNDAVQDPIHSDHEVVAHAYFVADSSTATECGKSGANPLPALAREELDNKSTRPGWPIKNELVTGVEQLQLQYGVDAAVTASNPPGDGSVDQYFNADHLQVTCGGSNPCWDQVRSVRFWVLVRDDCPDPGYTDTNTYKMGNLTYTPSGADLRFHRALYTSTVALRN